MALLPIPCWHARMRCDYYTIATRAIVLRLQRMDAVVLRLQHSAANENSEGLAAPEGYSVSTPMRMRRERRRVFRTGSRATKVQRRASVPREYSEPARYRRRGT